MSLAAISTLLDQAAPGHPTKRQILRPSDTARGNLLGRATPQKASNDMSLASCMHMPKLGPIECAASELNEER